MESLVKRESLKKKATPNNNGGNSFFTINLSRTGVLYIVASVLQASWIYIVLSHWPQTVRLAEMPVLGWAFAVLWVVMLLCVPNLLYIGVQLIRFSRDPDIVIAQNPMEKKKHKSICVLLLLGILVDLTAVPILLLYVEDKGVVVFLSGMMGGRIAQVNLEAILQYHKL